MIGREGEGGGKRLTISTAQIASVAAIAMYHRYSTITKPSDLLEYCCTGIHTNLLTTFLNKDVREKTVLW